MALTVGVVVLLTSTMCRLLALLCALLASLGVQAGDIGGGAMSSCSSMSGGSMGCGAGISPPGSEVAWTTYLDHNFVTLRENWVACTTATGCFLDNSYVDNATACIGVDGDGASITGLTQGTSDTNYTSPQDDEASSDVTHAKSCYINDANAYQLTWQDPFTCIVAGSSSTNTNASLQYAIDHNDAAGNNGWGLRNEGDAARLVVNATPSFLSCAAANNYGYEEKYALVMARKTGDGAGSSYHVAVNQQVTACAAAAYDPGDPGASRDIHFGSRQAGDLPFRGLLSRVRCYTGAQTDAWFAEQVARLDGRYNPTYAFTHTYDRTATTVSRVWQLDADGFYIPYERGLLRVTSSGALIERAHSNTWASSTAFNAFDVGSWTNVGTPTINAAAASGPFSRFRNTAEADEIVDDDGAASEGKQGATAGTTEGDYTASCFVRTGLTGTTTTEVTIGIVVTGGTGSTTCAFTDLTSSFVRKTCTTTAGDTPTAINGQVLVGNAAADTGSVIVAHCQMDNADFARAPTSESTTTVADILYVPAAETASWFGGSTAAAFNRGGEVSVVYTMAHTVPAGGHDDFQFLLDLLGTGGGAPDATDHKFLLYREDSAQGGELCMSIRHGADATEEDTCTTSHPEWTAGTQYVARSRWTPCGAGHCHYLYWDTCGDATTCAATTLVASDTDGSKQVTDYASDRAGIGERYDHSSHLDGYVARYVVRGPP